MMGSWSSWLRRRLDVAEITGSSPVEPMKLLTSSVRLVRSRIAMINYKPFDLTGG